MNAEKDYMQTMFQQLKKEILSEEMQKAFPNYPKLVTKTFDIPQVNGECGCDMAIYISKDLKGDRLFEVITHELYHFMAPGLRMFTNDSMDWDESDENTIQAKTIEYCKSKIPNFKTDWNPSEHFRSFYKPINPEYWLAMQICILEFGLKGDEFTEEDFKKQKLLLPQLYTILSLDNDIDIIIDHDQYTVMRDGMEKIVDKCVKMYNKYYNKNQWFHIEISDDFLCVEVELVDNKGE